MSQQEEAAKRLAALRHWQMPAAEAQEKARQVAQKATEAQILEAKALEEKRNVQNVQPPVT